MTHKLVAIHQPNFFPWLGYFDKIARADTFILLDDAQFPKKGGTWCNRVKLLVNGQAQWVTMPIVRSYHGVRDINEMHINEQIRWRDKCLQTIRMNYGKAPYYPQIFPVLTTLMAQTTNRLSAFNITVIRTLAELLQLNDVKLVLSSELAVRGRATERLIGLVQAVGGAGYLCGGGAADYQQDAEFAAAGLSLVYQDFQHPQYAQTQASTFAPGLSIIDALMHCDVAQIRGLLKWS